MEDNLDADSPVSIIYNVQFKQFVNLLLITFHFLTINLFLCPQFLQNKIFISVYSIFWITIPASFKVSLNVLNLRDIFLKVNRHLLWFEWSLSWSSATENRFNMERKVWRSQNNNWNNQYKYKANIHRIFDD